MNKHTPGPWRVKRGTWFDDKNRLLDYFWVGFGEIGNETTILSKKLLENEANARLIAAAPELLDFVKGMAAYFKANPNGYEDYLKFSQALIAKAEGTNL